MEYLELFKTLFALKVRYLLCGGMAVNIYGVPRMTADIDLLLDFEEENLKVFSDAMKKNNYKPLLPVSINQLLDAGKRKEMAQKKNMIAYSYHNFIKNYMAVDVLLESPHSFSELWNRREVRSMSGYDINVVSMTDLIEMKNFSARIQDMQDANLLSKLIKK